MIEVSQADSPSQSINQSMLYLSIITVLHINNNLKSKGKYCNNGWVNTETLLLLSYDMTSVHPHSYYSHKLGSIIPCIHTTFIQHSYNIHTTFIQHSYNIHTTFIQHSYNIHTTFIQHSYSIHTTFIQHSCNIHATFMQHSCNIHTTFIQHSYNIHTTFIQHSYNIHTTFIQYPTRLTNICTVHI